jgi:hypothetical protein
MNVTPESLEEPDSLLNQLAQANDLADPMCSRSEWLLSYHAVFAPQRTLLLRASEGSLLALARVVHPLIGPLFEPLESHWFFPNPLLGPDAVHLLEAVLGEPEYERSRPSLAISGLQWGSLQFHQLTRLLKRRYEVGFLEPTLFRSASLEAGTDGFLSRRSAKFRGNLRKAIQKGQAAGIEFVRCPTNLSAEDAAAAYARMLAVEESSWKGREHCGISQEPFRTFYGEVFRRMCQNGRARAIFATRDGLDVGFVMGGVDGIHYRGQQFSYVADLASLSIGNLLQWKQIEWLCEEGIARYDMGSVLDYKLHWTELELKSHTLVWRPGW